MDAKCPNCGCTVFEEIDFPGYACPECGWVEDEVIETKKKTVVPHPSVVAADEIEKKYPLDTHWEQYWKEVRNQWEKGLSDIVDCIYREMDGLDLGDMSHKVMELVGLFGDDWRMYDDMKSVVEKLPMID